MKPRYALVLVVVTAPLVAMPVLAKELWEQPWIEVKSPHFVVVSAISEFRTISLVHDLENFRSAVQMITNIERFEERIPTMLYVLPRRIEELGLTTNASGFFFAVDAGKLCRGCRV